MSIGPTKNVYRENDLTLERVVGRRCLSDGILDKVSNVSQELQAIVDTLNNIVACRKVTAEDIARISPDFSPKAKTLPSQKLNTIVKTSDPIRNIARKSFLNNILLDQDIERLYLAIEPSGVALMRDVLRIKSEVFIDASIVDEDKIWDMVHQVTTMSGYHVLCGIYGHERRPVNTLTIREELHISETRVCQIYDKMIYRIRRYARNPLTYKNVIAWMFGVDVTSVANTVYSMAHFLDFVSPIESNCTLSPIEKEVITEEEHKEVDCEQTKAYADAGCSEKSDAWLLSSAILDRFRIGIIDVSKVNGERIVSFVKTRDEFQDFIEDVCLGYSADLHKLSEKYLVGPEFMERILLFIQQKLPLLYKCAIYQPDGGWLNLAFRRSKTLAKEFEMFMRREFPKTKIVGMDEMTLGNNKDGVLKVIYDDPETRKRWTVVITEDLVTVDGKRLIISMRKVGDGVVQYMDTVNNVVCESTIGRMIDSMRDVVDAMKLHNKLSDDAD